MAVFDGLRMTRSGIIFIVGLVVLGGLVTGGIFIVKNHGEAVRRDEAVKIAEQNLTDQSKVANQPISGATTSDADAAKTDTSTAGSDSTGATTDAAGSDVVASDDTAATSAVNTASAAATATELPVTGINDLQLVGQSAMLAVLAFLAASYVVSRRHSDQL